MYVLYIRHVINMIVVNDKKYSVELRFVIVYQGSLSSLMTADRAGWER